MKYLIIFFFSSIFLSPYAQKDELKCKKDSGYVNHIYRKYANIKTVNWKDIEYNSDDNSHYYKERPRKKVKGYLGENEALEYVKRGKRYKRLVYYSYCRSKIKDVHFFYPNNRNGKTIHIYYYENGKKKSKKIQKNSKPTKEIKWDLDGNKTIKIIEKQGRYY